MMQHDEFLKLFLKCESTLRAFVLSMIRDREKSEDVFQDVALLLWENFERYDRSRPFGAWARGVAANRILKHWESVRRTQRSLSPEALQAVATAYDSQENEISLEQDALRDCLKTLPEKSRSLLVLRYEHSLKLEQIAARIGASFETASKTLSRIRIGLQRCIEQRLSRSEAT